MVGVVIDKFGGMAPSIQPSSLAENIAQLSVNSRVDSGALDGWHMPLQIEDVTTESEPRSLTKDVSSGGWVLSPFSIHREDSIVPEDEWERVYESRFDPRYSDSDPANLGSYPRVYVQGAEFRLGVPAPSNPPTVTRAGDPPEIDDPDADLVFYVFTYVTAQGEEGPPSPASIGVTRLNGQQVDVSGMVNLPGPYNMVAGSKRIYRSNTGSGATAFQFVAEIDAVETTYSDTIENDLLQEVISTVEFDPPPGPEAIDGMLRHLVGLPNGVLAGHTRKSICFSEPFLPYAWPRSYYKTFSENIVSIAPLLDGLIILTDAKPYRVIGATPDSMSLEPMDSDQSCQSAMSVVDMGGLVIYAGADGLCVASGMQVNVATASYMEKRDWLAYAPSTIRGFRYEGFYIGFFDSPVKGKAGFIFDPRDSSFHELDLHAHAGFQDTDTNELVLAIRQGVTTTYSLKQFDAGAMKMPVRWKSRLWITPRKVALSAARVQADSYPQTVKIWADGYQVTLTVEDDEAFRLPASLGKSKRYEFQFEGQGRIEYATFQESMQELI